MVRLGSENELRTRTAATPAPNNRVPRRPRNEPRLKAGVTVCGAVTSAAILRLSSLGGPSGPVPRIH